MSVWNGYDIPLTDFTGLVTKNHIAQLIFSGNPAGAGTVFIDNVYFSNVALGVANFDTVDFKMYPNPTNDLLTLTSSSLLGDISIYNALGQVVLKQHAETNETIIDVSNFSSGLYVIATQVGKESIRKQFVKK
ncbi:T9SS type A sorting domain-containing protein [Flavobacterium phycosphaerae]|uniref:T9SS type A sorting domain-containing protein n=1 Tax=Flavobacterium phycosphaerae TaxID=2697515 RepID=UPI001389B774|nr:T9SS type A sorting domain-containing protein [Flavobacterium phycosphaerae]